jgi:NAD(P)-dependent dehydrogenase (short-subunit alcohol dehydrogenase family)
VQRASSLYDLDPCTGCGISTCFLFSSGLWGIVNNAGASTFGHVEWVPISVCRKHLEVNIWGMMRVIQTFLPLIRRSKGMYISHN